jgi:hypothetical protein
MRFRSLQQVVLPTVIAKGPHKNSVLALAEELRALAAKAQGVRIENIGVNIALTGRSEWPRTVRTRH